MKKEIDICGAPGCIRFCKEKGYICDPKNYCRDCNKKKEDCVCKKNEVLQEIKVKLNQLKE